MLRKAVLAAVAIGLTAAASPARYTDPDGRFTFSLPAGCRALAATATTPAYASCGDGYALVVFKRDGSDRPALQRVVNAIISKWSNLKLLENHEGPTLDALPARYIFAEGKGPDGRLDDIEMLAVAKDGGWYVLAFALPALEWSTDAPGYFAPIKTSFHFSRR